MKKVFIGLFMIIITSVILFSFTSCPKAPAPKKQTGATKEKPKKETKSAAVKKARDVLSAKEASTVMGTSLVESKDPNDENIAPVVTGSSYFAYTNNGSTDDTRRKIFFSLAPSPTADGAKMAFDTGKKLAIENADAESIDNLGDGAYWIPNPGQFVAIKGRYQLVILIDQPEKDGRKDKAIAAAKIILPRLQQ